MSQPCVKCGSEIKPRVGCPKCAAFARRLRVYAYIIVVAAAALGMLAWYFANKARG